ncbi:hypothetical protein V1264_003051 [Littorina saxatilis]|uniref:Uncharacterized protein n=2 Tax=Littorina saxatilis TaxID=31220 RepID=A0AAN9G7V8_9CAEN
MDEDQMEEEFAPERIEPFAKMSQMSMSAPEKDISIPVKFRRNVFDDGSVIPPPDEEEASVGVGQMFHKPARHMRAQPRVPYSAMNPEERRQAEMLDTAVARQQLLLRQQQEVMAYAHRQQVEQQAQRLVNNSLAVGTTSTTPVNKQLQPHAERQKLNNLLNEACLLAPQRPGVQQPMAMQGGMAWVPAQPVISSEGYYNQVSVLNNAPAGVVPPTAVPGSFSVMGQDELMQAVRKELKRIQQE